MPGPPLEAAIAAGRGGGGAGRGDGGNATVHGTVLPHPQLLGPNQPFLGHERVVQHCREAGTMAGVPLQQEMDQILSLWRNVARHIVLAENHFRQSVFDRVSVKRGAAHQKGVEHAAQGPDIGFKTVGAVGGHLRGDVVGRPTHGEVLFIWEFELSGEAKVCDLNVHVARQQKVRQRQISMQDAVGV